jgi:RAQPRD family integrative conjugative element protein
MSTLPAWPALLILALATGPAAADADGERAALVRLVREIEALEPLLAEAERQADRRERTRFAYDWLRRDLRGMVAGIEAHAGRPRNEPRIVVPQDSVRNPE